MMNKFSIGTNAGIVWQTLRAEDRELSFDELVSKTGLQPAELAAAIGWLSREDKIAIVQRDNGEHFEVYKECYY